ncbi:MAG: molybdopterin converting factor subunit 1 [Thiobacillaceae bacterium]
MRIRILYFARLREAFGISQERPELPAGVATLGDLLDWLRSRGGVWAEQLAQGRAYRTAVNQDLAGLEVRLQDDDEVAIFPPVTGG